jgi:hypothetical protein
MKGTPPNGYPAFVLSSTKRRLVRESSWSLIDFLRPNTIQNANDPMLDGVFTGVTNSYPGHQVALLEDGLPSDGVS